MDLGSGDLGTFPPDGSTVLEICSRTQLSWGRGVQTHHRRVYSIKYSSNMKWFSRFMLLEALTTGELSVKNFSSICVQHI